MNSIQTINLLPEEEPKTHFLLEVENIMEQISAGQLNFNEGYDHILQLIGEKEMNHILQIQAEKAEKEFALAR